MAPEMVTSKAYGAKIDIWSFGCLVLEMFTGQQPWKGYAPQQALFTVSFSCVFFLSLYRSRSVLTLGPIIHADPPPLFCFLSTKQIGSSSAHPPIPETLPEEGQRFLARCFITDANQRPTAAELLQDPFAVPPPNFNFTDYIEGKITD